MAFIIRFTHINFKTDPRTFKARRKGCFIKNIIKCKFIIGNRNTLITGQIPIFTECYFQ